MSSSYKVSALCGPATKPSSIHFYLHAFTLTSGSTPWRDGSLVWEKGEGPSIMRANTSADLCLVPGTRYIFVGRLFERRPSYHLLGVLLFLQLGISAGSWALANLTQQLSGAAAAADLSFSPLERSNPDVGAHTRKALRAAVVWRVRAQPCRKFCTPVRPRVCTKNGSAVAHEGPWGPAKARPGVLVIS